MNFAKYLPALVVFGSLSWFVGCPSEVATPVQPPVPAPVVVPADNQGPTTATAPAAESESGKVAPPVVAAPVKPAPRLILASVLKSERIYFRTQAGDKQFQFKPKEADSVKFYDAAGTELCKLTMHPDKLKVKSADDQPLFELKWHGDKVAFKDGTTDKELSKLRFHGADFEFVVGETTRAKVVHQEGGGYQVQDTDGKPMGELSTQDGHAVWNSTAGTSLKCEETANPLALIGLALPDLTPPQQAALLVYFVSRPE